MALLRRLTLALLIAVVAVTAIGSGSFAVAKGHAHGGVAIKADCHCPDDSDCHSGLPCGKAAACVTTGTAIGADIYTAPFFATGSAVLCDYRSRVHPALGWPPPLHPPTT